MVGFSLVSEFLAIRKLASLSIDKRRKLTRLFRDVSLLDANAMNLDLRAVPELPTISSARVYRKSFTHIPSSFLVPNDVISLHIGDAVPCSCYLLDSDGKKLVSYESGDMFKRDESLFEMDNALNFDVVGIQRVKYAFVVLNAPLNDIIFAYRKTIRPQTLVDIQYAYFLKIVGNNLALIILLSSISVSILRLIFSKNRTTIDYIEILLINQVYTMLPIWILIQPIFIIIFRTFASARIVTLADALMTSKIEFTEDEDVDEFDIAPPPSKLVDVYFCESNLVIFNSSHNRQIVP